MKTMPISRMLCLVACFCSQHGKVEAASMCGGQPITEVLKVNGLPPAILTALHFNPSGREIADAGEPFNSSDVTQFQLPQRRLAVAGVGKKCAVVVIEQGGVFTSRSYWGFGFTAMCGWWRGGRGLMPCLVPCASWQSCPDPC